ncbi:MAG TPA: type II toxin-antitoxin system RelE/ParE family toxin [Prolixibacteraceae bacterium]|nr:type II toxin-antitoxin system RelE/ParE family toxin [Prolixibacteraceae bacterium]HPS13589.1 type II toxin-antitoxin system RelE/ParE family toxin [Prolixibacteraceae bacterium]
MNEVIILPTFEKEARRLIKKYRSLVTEISDFISTSEADGVQGTHLGNGIYKSRLSVKSKGRGKSGGVRIISYSEIYFSKQENNIYLVFIYDKSDISSVKRSEIEKILKEYR